MLEILTSNEFYHALVCSLITLGVILLYRNFFARHKRMLLVALFVFPPFTELVQYFMPGRTCSFDDIMMDYFGIFLIYAPYKIYREMLYARMERAHALCLSRNNRCRKSVLKHG